MGGFGRSAGSTASTSKHSSSGVPSAILPTHPNSKPSEEPPHPSSIPSTSLNPVGPETSQASSGSLRLIVEKQSASLSLPLSSLPSSSSEQEWNDTFWSKSSPIPIAGQSELIMCKQSIEHTFARACVNFYGRATRMHEFLARYSWLYDFSIFSSPGT
jgi:hypothetical protein